MCAQLNLVWSQGSSDSDVEDAEDYRKGARDSAPSTNGASLISIAVAGGYHAVSIGDLFNGKYRVISKLGVCWLKLECELILR